MMVGLAAGAGAQSTALTEPAVPLLPQSFGEWKVAAAPAAPVAAKVSLVEVSKEALEECGPQRSQVADYARDGRSLHVEAIEFGDRSGAFSAFTVVKRPNMSPLKELGAAAAAGDDAVLFTVGTSIVLASPATAADAAGLRALAGMMPKAAGNKGVAPLLPTLLPPKGLVDGSVRYALGGASYAAQGGVLPAGSLGWDKAGEAVTAEYKDKRGSETMTMLLYPTPAIAGTYTRTVQGLINAAGADRRKFGMARAKIFDVAHELRRVAGGPQVRMALRARGVGSGGEPRMSSMLFVARRAFWRKRLVGVVNGAIVAREAGSVAGLRAEKPGHLKMAGVAFRGEDGVGGRHLSAAVHSLVAGDPMPDEPQHSQKRHGQREPETPAPKRMRALEIIHVNALGSFFCCPFSVRHESSLLCFLASSPQ